MSKEEKIADLKRCIASWQKQYDQLVENFSGVRPSYVSTDLAMMWMRIERYKDRLAEMEGETE